MAGVRSKGLIPVMAGMALIVVLCIGGIVLLLYHQNNESPAPDDSGNNGGGGGSDGWVPDGIDTPRPQAYITADGTGFACYPVNFSGSSSEDPLGGGLLYSWDFDINDDIGTDAVGVNVQWTYQSAARYLVTLVVEDIQHRTNTATLSIDILNGTGHPPSENITTDEGNTGTMIYRKLVDSNLTHHFEMPSEVIKVECSLSWSDPGWTLSLLAGTGDDPDTGSTLLTGTGSSGKVVVVYQDRAGGYLPGGDWFLRVSLEDPGSHIPLEQCSYTIGIKVYYESPYDR